MSNPSDSTTSASAAVKIERAGPLLTITLDDPGSGNLVDALMAKAIVDAVKGIDDEVRAICIRGAGVDFCAGRKSPTPPKGGAVPTGEQLRKVVALPALALYDAIKSAPVPTIAIVQGRAFGVGAALASVCDIAIATDDATFQIPELERDIPPTLVMAALCDRVPQKTLAYLVFSRRTFTASEAMAHGLVSAVVNAADIESNSAEMIATITSTGAVALRACKQYLQHAPAMNPVAASAFASHVAGTALSARY